MHKLFKAGIRLVLIASSMGLLTACRPTLTVIPGDKLVVRVPAGHPYTPPVNGWFVPDARMLDILNRLDAAKIQGK